MRNRTPWPLIRGVSGDIHVTGAKPAVCAYLAVSVLLSGTVAFAAVPPVSAAPEKPSVRTHLTNITLDGLLRGPQFQGIGAISGGGGNSRLLIDYPAAQQRQILDYLFKPGYGASLQILKLEIGGDSNSTDGAEPSVQHSQGATNINCSAGYEFWLARQAHAINPAIKFYGLQWAAPGWVGGGKQTIWTKADISYVINWLKCARSYGLKISYIGGWNERGDGRQAGGPAWYADLRKKLNSNGFGATRIVAADSFTGNDDVAKTLKADSAFRAAVSVLGYHDTCNYPTTGITCYMSEVARQLGKPLWESEIGAMDSNSGAVDMARSINNSYIQAGVTGLLHWPLIDSMPPGLPYENRGLIWADQPWNGHYQVNLMTWAIAQTTQFVQPGWRHINGANAALGNAQWGTYDSYEAPDHSNWSMVVQTSLATAAQSIVVHVKGRLARSVVHVWRTSLQPGRPARWFVHVADAHPAGGAFSYRLQPNCVYTFSTSTGQGKGTATAPPPEPMPLRYTSRRDASNEPWGLAAQDGSFEYAGDGQTIVQAADAVPVFWHVSTRPRFPYAVVGGSSWRDYTVSVKVSFTAQSQSAGLVARYDRPTHIQPEQFTGYQFVVSASGAWALIRDRGTSAPVILTSGTSSPLAVGTWHTLTVAVHGTSLAASIGTQQVTSVTDSAYAAGIAGISTGGWYKVDFRDLTVSG